MGNLHFKNIAATVAVSGAMLLVATSPSHAVTESTSATVSFVDPITITEVTAMTFGNVSTTIADTETLILSTAGAVSGTGAGDYLAGALAGDSTVTSSTAQSLDIILQNAGQGTATNVTVDLTAFTCDYNGGAVTGSCATTLAVASPIASATLLYGSTATFGITGAGAQDNTTATPTFDIVVTYQ